MTSWQCSVWYFQPKMFCVLEQKSDMFDGMSTSHLLPIFVNDHVAERNISDDLFDIQTNKTIFSPHHNPMRWHPKWKVRHKLSETCCPNPRLPQLVAQRQPTSLTWKIRRVITATIHYSNPGRERPLKEGAPTQRDGMWGDWAQLGDSWPNETQKARRAERRGKAEVDRGGGERERKGPGCWVSVLESDLL